MVRQRPYWILSLLLVWAMWAGVYPARAALCSPIFASDVAVHGQGLLAYVAAVQAQFERGGSAGIGINALLDGLSTFRDHTRHLDVDTYTLDGHAEFQVGCVWDPGFSLSVAWNQGVGGQLSFSRSLLDFTGMLDPAHELAFSLTSQVEIRRGITLATEGIPLTKTAIGSAPIFQGGFSLQLWDVVDYHRASLSFDKPAGSLTIQTTESTQRRPNPATLPPPDMPDFRGGGYSIGAKLAWVPTNRLAVTYSVDALMSRHWAQGLISDTYSIETDRQFVGIDDYLENRPMAQGTIRPYSFSEKLSPVHRLQATVGAEYPVDIGIAFNLDQKLIHELSVGFRYSWGQSQWGLSWDAATKSVGGVFSYPYTRDRSGPWLDIKLQGDSVERLSLFALRVAADWLF